MAQTSTPKGKVSYTYYANGLRQSMTPAGQPTISYTYDNGNRLTRIEQAAAPANHNVAQRISVNCDAVDRRIQTTYANGITRTNSFDKAGQPVGLTYKTADDSLVGDLVYTYDDAQANLLWWWVLIAYIILTFVDDCASTSIDRKLALGETLSGAFAAVPVWLSKRRGPK